MLYHSGTDLNTDTSVANQAKAEGMAYDSVGDLIPQFQSIPIVISFYNQDISKTNLWISANFTADTPYILPWKRLAFGADHIQDGRDYNGPKFAIFVRTIS